MQHQVSDQPLFASPSDHRRLQAIAGRLTERRLDLARLDAEAADLHLLVGAAVKSRLPSARHAGQIAGAVEPLARLEREGIGDEPLRRQPRPASNIRAPAQRPPRYSSPATPTGQGCKRGVENIGARVRVGPPDVDVLCLDIAGDGSDVVSVGPYSLKTRMPGQCSWSVTTCAAVSASPPTIAISIALGSAG